MQIPSHSKQSGRLKKLSFQSLLATLFFISSLLISPTTFVQAANEGTSSSVSVTRISGNNRYSTSFAISKNGWTQCDYAILTTGESYPDALAAAPLAKKYNCPILLTSKYSLSDALVAELKRLSVKEVFILGGTGVISNDIETQLHKNDITATRLAGANRYETSVKISEKVGTNDAIAIASGEDFADALSIAPIASIKNMPVLLSPQNNLDKSVSNFINSKKIYKSYVIGNTTSVSDKVFNALNSSNPERIDGTDKYERNLNVIKKFQNEINFETVFIASGNDFPDSLSGSALAAKTNSPVILVNGYNSNRVKDLFKDKNIKNVIVLGGEGSISDSVQKDITGSITDIEKPTLKVVTVKNSQELLHNIAPNTKIILKAGDYNLLEPASPDNKYLSYNKVFDGSELVLKDINNLSIEAEKDAKVNLLIDPRYAYVLTFKDCNNISFSGVIAGHYPDKGSCSGGVFKFEDCKDIQINNSVLFGCGTEGLTLNDVSNLNFTNSTIRDCSYGVMTMADCKNINFTNSIFKDNEKFYSFNITHSDANFDKCTISNNKTSDNFGYLFDIDAYSHISVTNSTVENNSAKNITNYDGNITFKDVTFKGNSFDKH